MRFTFSAGAFARTLRHVVSEPLLLLGAPACPLWSMLLPFLTLTLTTSFRSGGAVITLSLPCARPTGPSTKRAAIRAVPRHFRFTVLVAAGDHAADRVHSHRPLL